MLTVYRLHKIFYGVIKDNNAQKRPESPCPSQQLPWVIGSLSATQDRVFSDSVIFLVINYNQSLHILVLNVSARLNSMLLTTSTQY